MTALIFALSQHIRTAPRLAPHRFPTLPPDACFVPDEVEQLACAVRQRVERLGGVRSQAGEGGHVMSPDEHVDGIDLEGVHARGESAQVRRRGTRRARAESLSGDRETARLDE